MSSISSWSTPQLPLFAFTCAQASLNTSSLHNLEKILFAFEHTGIYSFPLSCFLTENNINYTIIPGLEIKRSLGIQRGKDDKIDAKKIALYTARRKDEIIPYKLPSKCFLKMRRLLSLREKLVKQRAGYEGTMKENKRFLIKKENQTLFKVQEKNRVTNRNR